MGRLIGFLDQSDPFKDVSKKVIFHVMSLRLEFFITGNYIAVDHENIKTELKLWFLDQSDPFKYLDQIGSFFMS